MAASRSCQAATMLYRAGEMLLLLLLLLGVAARASAFEVVEASVADIHKAYKAGTLTSVMLTKMYLQRIALFNPILHSVLEVNPDALEIAARVDAERAKDPNLIKGLHGIPILLKDNIATADKTNTTAGSFDLLYSKVKQDASLLARVRSGGAIILGKASLSQWANYRSDNSISGWSSRGGFTICPYNLQQNPSGSSSGSAVSVAANLVAVTLGSETDGSIISPSNYNSAVGLKPTIGLVSRAGVIPISHSQDTVGPICRTLSDAVAVLDSIHVTKYDPADPATSKCLKHIPKGGYTQFLDKSTIKGKRLGILGEPAQIESTAHVLLMGAYAAANSEQRIASLLAGYSYPFFNYKKGPNQYINKYQLPYYKKHLATLKSLGAVMIDVTIPNILEYQDDGNETTVLNFDFKQDLASYLHGLAYAPTGRTLAKLIAANVHDPRERIDLFDQKIWIAAENTTGFSSPIYIAAKEADKKIRVKAFNEIFKKLSLDAYVAPTPNGAGYLSAKAGYPIITVPAGYAPRKQTADPVDTPFGLGFYGQLCSEPTLIEIAYAFEQATMVRKPPTFQGTLPTYASPDNVTNQAPIPYLIT